MTVMNYADSALSLLPPAVAIVLAILTRRVLLSLGLGILIGALLLNQFSPVATGEFVFNGVKGLFGQAKALIRGTYIFSVS